ncbi:dynamin family protein [Halovulum sp. GXIMD14794]
MSNADAPGRGSSATALMREMRSRSDTPTLAVMGEFSAGKSTLINLLLGREFLPRKVTATQMPAISLSFGDSQEFVSLGHDGTLSRHPIAGLRTRDPNRDAMISVRLPAPVLGAISLIDTPGISDPALQTEILAGVAGISDAVLWCTHATQAWRQSERATWSKMPAKLKERSVLVVTRADLLGPDDREKVRKRLLVETGGLFGKILFIATPQAFRALGAGDRDLWHRSGGAALFEALEVAVGVALPDPFAVPDPEDVRPPAAQEFFRVSSAPGPDVSRVAEDELVRASPETGPAPETSEAEMHAIDKVKRALTTGYQLLAPGKGVSVSEQTHNERTIAMNAETKVSSTDISGLNQVAGFIGACLVDSETGLMLGSEGGGNFDLEAAAAGNTEVVKAKLRAMQALDLDDKIEDILITLGKQFHLIRPLEDTPTVFLYVALDKNAANLGMARIQVKKVEQKISL